MPDDPVSRDAKKESMIRQALDPLVNRAICPTKLDDLVKHAMASYSLEGVNRFTLLPAAAHIESDPAAFAERLSHHYGPASASGQPVPSRQAKGLAEACFTAKGWDQAAQMAFVKKYGESSWAEAMRKAGANPDRPKHHPDNEPAMRDTRNRDTIVAGNIRRNFERRNQGR